MYAVERLGSYITRGVYTVSGPFHPFGGAVDIIVVEQPDGSFKSSPWYIKFGKFQGVLKAREKEVTINVNGTDANFHMFLDPRGEAHFLREVEGGEGESVSYVSYSSDDMDDQSQESRRIIKSKSCSYDGSESNSVIQFDESNGKIVAVTNSQQSRISRFMFGQRSMVGDVYRKGDDNVGVRRMSSLESAEIAADLVETFMLDEADLAKTLVQISEISRSIDEPRLKNADEDENAKDVTAAVTCSNSQIADVEACPEKKFDKNLASDERDAVLSSIDIPQEKNALSRVQSSIYCETSRSLIMGSDGLQDQSEEMLYLANGGSGDSHFCVETLHTTTKPLTEDTGNHQTGDLGLEGKHNGRSDISSHQTNPSSPSIHGHGRVDLGLPVTVTTSYTQMVCITPAIGSTEVKSKGASSISCISNSVDQIQDEVYSGDKVARNKLLESVDDSGELTEDCSLTKAAKVPLSESSEEDQFFFSDIDDCEPGENQGEPIFPDAVDKENSVQMNGSQNFESLTENSKVFSSPICIPRRHADPGAEVARQTESLPNMWSDTRQAESLPNMWSDIDNLGTKKVHHPLSHSLELDSNSLELNYKNSATGNENQSPQGDFNKEDTQASEGIKDGVNNPAVGDPSKAIDATSGSWSLWPFPFRSSKSKKTMQPTLNDTQKSDAGNVSASSLATDNDKNDVKDMKKIVKANTPTSEELASLNLKEGSNAVTFTFSTAMLGKQKVDARIYLWKWNTRIVISDVDGTITKSDVLGQFMPLVGIDWSQTGVVHLFSAIKDNGYQFLYLSARSISQAYITRQFLVNLKQDGKALPDGPVVISPDGLFPSLFREVIRRAPHEFKIACLEDIKALFPPDCSPFYAGFGNRDTDEISYLKVGIPKGKIFIINPKGEVAVNRLVNTRSYTSLHALLHGMFPVMKSHEQEDYNSWNFWKLPPPHLDF
ncbi:phosphatidate phosphatase PAH2-like [Euphorbia lathyris]|uniref:phosphatidate phosphatase PAH2-like n=1 Tax=Euphorbia lathyris TaxID=212925 RepID=UPI00331388DB